jgi:hypothetical protein
VRPVSTIEMTCEIDCLGWSRVDPLIAKSGTRRTS